MRVERIKNLSLKKQLARRVGNQTMQDMVHITAPPTTAFIVADDVLSLQPGQMRKEQFLARLYTAVCQTVAETTADTLWADMDCPYIDYWFAYYSQQESSHLQRAVYKFAPQTKAAKTAQAFIPLICQRIQESLMVWPSLERDKQAHPLTRWGHALWRRIHRVFDGKTKRS